MFERSMKPVSLRAAAAAAFAVLLPLSVLAEGGSMLQPNWEDPEVRSFLDERAKTRALGPSEETPRDKVKLPVLEMTTPPSVAERSMGASPQPQAEPVFIYDENNPVWYQVTETYGDVTVTVEADLRVQHTLGPDEKIYESETRSAAPGEPEVTFYADAEEVEGSPGYIAEYTVEKFGIPYTVRVECTKENKDDCADSAKIAETRALLKITGGNPPSSP